jgi:hypothetical protein
MPVTGAIHCTFLYLIILTIFGSTWGTGSWVHMADNLANVMRQLSRNYGSLNLL